MTVRFTSIVLVVTLAYGFWSLRIHEFIAVGSSHVNSIKRAILIVEVLIAVVVARKIIISGLFFALWYNSLLNLVSLSE